MSYIEAEKPTNSNRWWEAVYNTAAGVIAEQLSNASKKSDGITDFLICSSSYSKTFFISWQTKINAELGRISTRIFKPNHDVVSTN